MNDAIPFIVLGVIALALLLLVARDALMNYLWNRYGYEGNRVSFLPDYKHVLFVTYTDTPRRRALFIALPFSDYRRNFAGDYFWRQLVLVWMQGSGFTLDYLKTMPEKRELSCK